MMEHLLDTCDTELFLREREILKAQTLLSKCDSSNTSIDDNDNLYELTRLRFRWLGFEATNVQHRTIPSHVDEGVAEAFQNYDEASGWNISVIFDTGALEDAHGTFANSGLDAMEMSRQLAGFIQHWLYVRLLEVALGKQIESSFLTKRAKDQILYLDSRRINFALAAWVEDSKEMKASDKFKMIHTVRSCCTIVLEALFELLSIHGGPADGPGEPFKKYDITHFPELHELLLDMAPAIIALNEAILQSLQLLGDETPIHIFPTYYNTIFTSRNARLQQRGWCPVIISRFQQTMTSSVLAYFDASQLENPAKGHGSCSNTTCHRNNVDIDTYQQQHSLEGCSCLKVSPLFQEVTTAIREKQIPVISISNAEKLATSIARDTPYVAISHVWADGLGSTTEQGMYWCQAKRLSSFASDAAGLGTAFWVDSLCIPEATEYRKEAIAMMKSVYQNATKVVVVDRSICQQSAQQTIMSLIYIVATSSWMQRLWTYPEAYLASSILLAFSDRLVDLQELIDQAIRMAAVPSAQQLLSKLCEPLILELLSLVPQPQAPHRLPISRVLDVMRSRSTSRKSDETIAVSTVLNVDTRELLRMDGDERMITPFLQVSRVPWFILFDKRPKVLREPYRWMPSTFLCWTADPLDVSRNPVHAYCTKEGLKARIAVLELDSDLDLHGNTPYYINTNGAWLELEPRDQNSSVSVDAKVKMLLVHYLDENLPPEATLGTGSTEPVILATARTGIPRKISCLFGLDWRIRRMPEDYSPGHKSPTLRASWKVDDVLIT